MSLRTMAASTAAVAVVTIAVPSYGQITGQHLATEPVPYVDRPLTLPKLHANGGLEVTFTHAEGSDFPLDSSSGFIDIDGALGITDDIEIEATLFSLATKEVNIWPLGVELIDGADWGMFRLGATLRFVGEDVADIGGRFRFLVDNNATIGLSGSLPIRLRAPKVFRFDTGFSFIGIIPTIDGFDPVFSLTDVSANLSAPDAGIPLRFAFQPVEEFWFGVNTGFGCSDVTKDEAIFLPLGANLGGTVPLDKDLLLDLIGSFSFPAFVIPAGFDTDARVGSELWQVGLTGRMYFKLPT